jgi:hypothetical protein
MGCPMVCFQYALKLAYQTNRSDRRYSTVRSHQHAPRMHRGRPGTVRNERRLSIMRTLCGQAALQREESQGVGARYK